MKIQFPVTRSLVVMVLLLIVLATLTSCWNFTTAGMCYWTFQHQAEAIAFTEQSEQLTIYRFFEFPKKQGTLKVFGYGHRDPDSNYVLELKIESRDMTPDEHLKYRPDDVQVSVGETELKLLSTARELYDWGESTSFVRLSCPMTSLWDTTSERLKERHIEISIDLSSFVFSNDAAIPLDPVHAVQKVPVPLRE